MRSNGTLEDEIALQEAAEAGDVGAQLKYGKMLCGLADRVVIDGSAGEDDAHIVRYCDESTDGIEWLKKAAEAGNSEAAELLAGICDGSVHLPSMVEFYFNEAMRYIKGESCGRDLERAERLLLDSAEGGFVPAQRELAKLCLGLIDKEDSREPVYCADPMHWLKVAAEADDGEAQHLLACIECKGVFNHYPVGDSGFAEGLKWLKERADAGDSVSQCQYGCILIWADSPADMSGVEYLRRSYENGCAQAAFQLGDLYWETRYYWGDEFTPDKKEAIIWFEKAIERGNIPATDRMSRIIYLENRDDFKWDGGEQHSEDYDKLFKYTKIAADADCDFAKMRLAVLYAIGIGVAVDMDKAKSLILEDYCRHQGYCTAEKCLKMVDGEKMTVREALYECRNLID